MIQYSVIKDSSAPITAGTRVPKIVQLQTRFVVTKFLITHQVRTDCTSSVQVIASMTCTAHWPGPKKAKRHVEFDKAVKRSQ